MYYLVITGSRTYTHDAHVRSVIHELYHQAAKEGHSLTVVAGEANRGLDRIVSDYAQNQAIFKYKGFPADWKTHGKLAGFIRNEQMIRDIVFAEDARHEQVFGAAFYHESGPTNGTRDAHARLKGYGIPTRVYSGTSLIDYDPGTPVRLR